MSRRFNPTEKATPCRFFDGSRTGGFKYLLSNSNYAYKSFKILLTVDWERLQPSVKASPMAQTKKWALTALRQGSAQRYLISTDELTGVISSFMKVSESFLIPGRSENTFFITVCLIAKHTSLHVDQYIRCK